MEEFSVGDTVLAKWKGEFHVAIVIKVDNTSFEVKLSETGQALVYTIEDRSYASEKDSNSIPDSSSTVSIIKNTDPNAGELTVGTQVCTQITAKTKYQTGCIAVSYTHLTLPTIYSV